MALRGGRALRATLAHLQPAAATDTEADNHIDWPIAPRCHGPESDPPGADQLGISPEEAAFFKENGFLIKRGVVHAADLAPFVEEFWRTIAPPCVDRHDPCTWVDPGSRDSWGPSAEHAAETEKAGRVVRPYPVGYGDGNIEWTEIGRRGHRR
jgi:hypothetical protein